jgi:hypothetical protein
LRNAASDTVEAKRLTVTLACGYARHTLHIHEDKYPEDKRPRKAIETAEAWLKGEATEQECRDAANAADAAAYAAAYAADAAAYAADAADAAAYAARAAYAAERAWQLQFTRDTINQIFGG